MLGKHVPNTVWSVSHIHFEAFTNSGRIHLSPSYIVFYTGVETSCKDLRQVLPDVKNGEWMRILGLFLVTDFGVT